MPSSQTQRRKTPAFLVSLSGLILVVSLATVGFSGATEPPAWITKVKTSISSVLNSEESPAAFGVKIIGIIHPSGTNASLDDVQYIEASQGHLIVQFSLSWKGGLTGAGYKTVVNWDTTEEGPIGNLVQSDNAPTSISKGALRKLDDYFNNTFSVDSENTQRPQKIKQQSRKAKIKVQNPLSAISEIRGALQSFYADNEGLFPGDLKDLAPKYLLKVPYISITPSLVTNSVAHPTTANKDVCGSVTGTGGWLYFNNSNDSGTWGSIAIDSTDKSPEGKRWCEY